MKQKQTVGFLLRLSIASVFLYAAIASFLQPDNWVGFFPPFLSKIFPLGFILNGFSFYQFSLSLWLLSGKKTFYAAILAAITLLGIITVNFAQLDILFRDFAILIGAIALAVQNYPKKK